GLRVGIDCWTCWSSPPPEPRPPTPARPETPPPPGNVERSLDDGVPGRMCSSLPGPFSSSRPADQPHAHHYQDEDRCHYRDQWGEAEYQTRWTQQVLEDAETEAHQHPGEYPLAERYRAQRAEDEGDGDKHQ